jgi:outer membrane murein-binding lipoprotein Lpp
MRWWIMAAAVAALLAGCGNRSMFGSQLDRDLAELNATMERGEVELACERLKKVTPQFAQWAEGARGERAARANQLLEQLSGLQTFCGVPPLADSRNLASSWPPLYQEMRRISTYKTSWMTVFTYVSMLAVGIGMYLFLRRMRSAH